MVEEWTPPSLQNTSFRGRGRLEAASSQKARSGSRRSWRISPEKLTEELLHTSIAAGLQTGNHGDPQIRDTSRAGPLQETANSSNSIGKRLTLNCLLIRNESKAEERKSATRVPRHQHVPTDPAAGFRSRVHGCCARHAQISNNHFHEAFIKSLKDP